MSSEKGSQRLLFQGDTDNQVTLACKACEPLDVPEETRVPGRSQELRLALGLGSP